MSETLQQLQQLAQKPSAVEWFKGLFDRAHVEISDSNEKFTVVHRGDSVDIHEGLDGDAPNLIIPLASENIRNLNRFFDDDGIDAHEQYRIVKFMIKPCLQASLEMPVLQHQMVRAILRIDEHWHQSLIAPDGSEDEPLTVRCENNKWTITPGHEGTPQRRLRFTPEQAIEYQRQVFAANSQNSIPVWLELARWYSDFREQITVR